MEKTPAFAAAHRQEQINFLNNVFVNVSRHVELVNAAIYALSAVMKWPDTQNQEAWGEGPKPVPKVLCQIPWPSSLVPPHFNSHLKWLKVQYHVRVEMRHPCVNNLGRCPISFHRTFLFRNGRENNGIDTSRSRLPSVPKHSAATPAPFSRTTNK